MEATTHTELVAPFAGCMQELPGIFGWRPSGRNDQSGSVQRSAAKPTAGHYRAPCRVPDAAHLATFPHW